MTTMRKLLLLIPLLLGCPNQNGPQPKPTPVPTDTNQCDNAEINLQLHCPSLAMTPDGTPFGLFCKDVQANGLAINPACIAVAKDCDQAKDCLRKL